MILAAIGWRTHVLEGGYKAYRRHILDSLESLPARFSWVAINGLTGSGKTQILHRLAERGEQILDLEGLAHHKGSVLGLDPDEPQPSQKLFESRIHQALAPLDRNRPVFVEAESKKVGNVHCPELLWRTMTAAAVVRVEIPRAERVRFLLRDYGHFLQNPVLLRERIGLLRERYGAAQIESWESLIAAEDWPAFVESILEIHYDPSYSKSKRYPEPKAVVAAPDLSENSVMQLAEAIQEAVG